MRRYLIHIIFFLCVLSLPVTAQDKDSLSVFIEQNPYAVDFNIIYEGSKLNLSADDHYLLVNLSIAHPALQMRFLMQKLTLYIDPSGKKRKSYEIALPSAFDVKDEIEAAIPKPALERKEDMRPDIRPLISALNRKGADILYKDGYTHLGFQNFHIELDARNNLLNFYILVPKEKMMQDRKLSDRWTIGIFSINNRGNMPSPSGEGDSEMVPPPIEGENQLAIQELMQSDIREWVGFSIDDVNNINLKAPETVKAEATQNGDSIEFKLTAYEIETQLTFLMQGLEVSVFQPDTLTMSFPSAAMVRNKVKRHPNEVKAVLASPKEQLVGRDTIHHVIRPDVQPLVSALNDTTACITYKGKKNITHGFKIDIDREKAIMSFVIRTGRNMVKIQDDVLHLMLSSIPSYHLGDRAEFDGIRFSREKTPHPKGLGEGIRKEDVDKRTYRNSIFVKIKQSY